MPKTSKQQLDELLGILDDVKSTIVPTNPPPAPPSPEQVIPDDLPGSGTDSVQKAASFTQQVVPAPAPGGQSTSIPQVQASSSDGLNIMAKDDAELMATEKNLAEIDELIAVSKNVMSHVYGVVTSTDILDAATIAAAAKLINETRALIAEHLTIQKDERDFLNKVQMEEIKHRHQMELMEKKFELEQKRFQQKNPALNAPANNVQPVSPASNGMKAYSSADLMKMISEDQ